MATIKDFRDFKVWQEARILCQEVSLLIKTEPFSKDYALVNQINRSSGSVIDNIAEGYGRAGNREFIQYLAISKGSCSETLSQLIRAYDRKYLSDEKFEKLDLFVNSLINQLGGLMNYLQKSDFKGNKFTLRHTSTHFDTLRHTSTGSVESAQCIAIHKPKNPNE